MQLLILLVHVVLALALVGVVLIQQGKGADAGASFGGGASQTVFGSRGSSSFLAKLTGVLITLFFITALVLAWMGQHGTGQSGTSGLPDASIIEQQRSMVPSLDDSSSAGSTDSSDDAASQSEDFEASDELVLPDEEGAAGEADFEFEDLEAESESGQ